MQSARLFSATFMLANENQPRFTSGGCMSEKIHPRDGILTSQPQNVQAKDEEQQMVEPLFLYISMDLFFKMETPKRWQWLSQGWTHEMGLRGDFYFFVLVFSRVFIVIVFCMTRLKTIINTIFRMREYYSLSHPTGHVPQEEKVSEWNKKYCYSSSCSGPCWAWIFFF